MIPSGEVVKLKKHTSDMPDMHCVYLVAARTEGVLFVSGSSGKAKSCTYPASSVTGGVKAWLERTAAEYRAKGYQDQMLSLPKAVTDYCASHDPAPNVINVEIVEEDFY